MRWNIQSSETQEGEELSPMSHALPEGCRIRQLRAKVLVSNARKRRLGSGEDPRVQLVLLYEEGGLEWTGVNFSPCGRDIQAAESIILINSKVYL